MGAVRGAERVVDIDFSHISQLLGKRRIVLGFALLKADVLKQAWLRRAFSAAAIAD